MEATPTPQIADVGWLAVVFTRPGGRASQQALGAQNSFPNLFIVGAGKAGTSALAEYLGTHPDVYMAPRKELNYFGRDLDYRARRLGSEEYLAFFEGSEGHRYRGDASVQYLLSATAAAEIKEASPDAKVLIMLRNPVEVIHARHAQNVYAGDEPITDFAAALAAEPKRRQGNDIPAHVSCVEWLFYRRWVAFTEQVGRYLETFGCENVWIGLFDDLRSDPLSLYRSVMTFLALDTSSPPVFRPINRNQRAWSLRAQWLLTGRQPAVKAAARLIVPNAAVRAAVVKRLIALNSRVAARRPMPPELRSKLVAALTPEVESLASLINRDLSGWTRET